MQVDIPRSWSKVLREELRSPGFARLSRFVDAERRRHTVFPPAEDVFAAFRLTPYNRVAVLLLGQDPYHDEGQAHGLCFSVRQGVAPPPSLKNILSELHDDLGCPRPEHGCLAAWARQGVLMLNTVLTVRAHQPHSHRGQGWETFTDAVIRKVNKKSRPIVFVLWGKPAQQKERWIDTARHSVVKSAHPSPLSARRGFFGSRPFSQVNTQLRRLGRAEIDWCLDKRAE
jgi:uracil-DNA glycosylase